MSVIIAKVSETINLFKSNTYTHSLSNNIVYIISVLFHISNSYNFASSILGAVISFFHFAL